MLALAGLPGPARAASASFVISQVYGGGGNSGAPFANDYIELFNRGTTTASLAGWSLQYASATGTGNLGASSAQLTEPKSTQIPCDSTAPVDGIETTVSADSSGLQYDPATDTYTYVWKTDKAWARTCRQLVLRLDDGTCHRADFLLTK